MSGKRKRFDCGHWGFGRYCHRCYDAEQLSHFAVQENVEERVALALREEAKRLRKGGKIVEGL